MDGAHRPGEEERVYHESTSGDVVYAGTLSLPLPVDGTSKVDGDIGRGGEGRGSDAHTGIIESQLDAR